MHINPTNKLYEFILSIISINAFSYFSAILPSVSRYSLDRTDGFGIKSFVLSPCCIMTTLQGINALFGYIGLFFIIRFVGLQAWGYLSFSLAFIGVLSIVGDLGYGTAHLRYLSSGEYSEGVCNGTFLTIRTVQTMITIGIVLGSLFVWIDILHRGLENNVEI